jgi:hypothetical protein
MIYIMEEFEDSKRLIRILKDRQHNGKLYIHDIIQTIQQNRYFDATMHASVIVDHHEYYICFIWNNIQIYLHQETNIQYIPNYYTFMPSCRKIHRLITNCKAPELKAIYIHSEYGTVMAVVVW